MAYFTAPDLQPSHRSLQTKQLELEYERSTRRVDDIVHKENTRQLRLRTILLKCDNERLQHRASSGDGKSEVAERKATRMAQRAAQLEEMLQVESRNRAQESEELQAQIASLETIAADSAKCLAEKLALSREMSTIRQELEHFRLQATTNQNILSEKLSLEHQLSAMEVKLELEQRAVKRLSEKKNKAAEQDALLLEEVDTLRKELAKEKRERQQAEKDITKATQSSENRVALLEDRVEALKTKLRSTKEQLKDTKLELKKSEAEVVRLSSRAEAEKPTKNVRKRKASALDQDETIGTPDGLGSRLGLLKRTSTLPGDKSTFSITPFLNRTASIAPESPPESPVEEAPPQPEQAPVDKEDLDPIGSAVDSDASIDIPSLASKAGNKRRKGKAAAEPPASDDDQPPPRILSTSKQAKTNSRVRKTNIPALAAVPEEAHDENILPSISIPPKLSARQLAEEFPEPDPVKASQAPETKARKRKALGAGRAKTLFDDDDAETKDVGRKAVFAGGKSLATLTKTGLGASKSRVIGTSAGGFGQFSPRKKEKRAMNRSMLQ